MLKASLLIFIIGLFSKESMGTNPEVKTTQLKKGPQIKAETFSSNSFPEIKSKDLALIDNALKNYGPIGQVPGEEKDHSRGIEFYLKEHNVKIEEHEKDFLLFIYPKKGSWEFNANIIKASGKLENPVIGTIEAAP